MSITVISPVLNEVDFIGYSILATVKYVDEYIYILDEASNDGTRELLQHIKKKYAGPKLVIGDCPTFNPLDMKDYNACFNIAIGCSHSQLIWFLHPDMIVTNPEKILELNDDSLAWITDVTSYAGDLETQIVQGRVAKWKNIHANKFRLHYYGGYGSQNEDFYHKDITGRTYKHYGQEFSKYPFQVSESGIQINHYCEVKNYKRRLEKMKLCIKTQYPDFDDLKIEEMAVQHPRVTLEPSSTIFGKFEFAPAQAPVPEVFSKYKKEFEAFKKEPNLVEA